MGDVAGGEGSDGDLGFSAVEVGDVAAQVLEEFLPGKHQGAGEIAAGDGDPSVVGVTDGGGVAVVVEADGGWRCGRVEGFGVMGDLAGGVGAGEVDLEGALRGVVGGFGCPVGAADDQ
ncbi:hypothetical protein CcI49_19960 [Frankia sp. CcI49]|nr:hypothetical protein CcI49_19960 [Frankia sp. CcI49]